jgi:drug/metabolite transporter (DMT)-like permease
MTTHATEKPVLLAKKLGGVLLLVCGLVLIALGYGNGADAVVMLGFLLASGGLALMLMKIVRRNRSGPP